MKDKKKRKKSKKQKKKKSSELVTYQEWTLQVMPISHAEPSRVGYLWKAKEKKEKKETKQFRFFLHQATHPKST